MKPVIDNFSKQVAAYRAGRPTYPKALYDFILSHCTGREAAWDCATGNGQVAVALSNHFQQVTASDISSTQLAAAESRPNITYVEARAEATPFADRAFDLITVGQAAHWFDMEAFNHEVHRVARPGACICLFGYVLLSINEPIDAIVQELYEPVLGGYWSPERRLVEEGLASLPFDYTELETPKNLAYTAQWTVDRLLTYLDSWSATQKYKDQQDADPVAPFADRLREAWGPTVRTVHFPVFLRMGRVE